MSVRVDDLIDSNTFKDSNSIRLGGKDVGITAAYGAESMMSLLAFPEPDIFLRILKDIGNDKPRVDKRTTRHIESKVSGRSFVKVKRGSK